MPRIGKAIKMSEEITNNEETIEDNTVIIEPNNDGNEINDAVEEGSTEQSNVTEINKVRAELDEVKDKYLRLLAEFDNYKKRTTKERLDLITSASKETLVAMLPIADDFDRAKKASEAENSTEQFSEGVTLVYNKFFSIMESKGVKAMDSTGQSFDAEQHEAITEIPAFTPEMVGKVIDTVEKGYYLNDKIIRYAKVVVGK
jgi:molecular chaperone GrpE